MRPLASLGAKGMYPAKPNSRFGVEPAMLLLLMFRRQPNEPDIHRVRGVTNTTANQRERST